MSTAEAKKTTQIMSKTVMETYKKNAKKSITPLTCDALHGVFYASSNKLLLLLFKLHIFNIANKKN